MVKVDSLEEYWELEDLSNSKPSRRKDLGDIVKGIKDAQRKQTGINRQNFSGVPSADFGSNTSSASGSGSSKSTISTVGLLKTAGGTMVGPIAFFPAATIISSGGVLDISKATGEAFSSRVIVTGYLAAADNLVTITGAAHAGQILFLQATATTPITLKHATGNIYMPSGADYVVAGKEIVLLQWDTINTTWTLLTSTSGTGVQIGDSPTWTGAHTFTGTVVSFANSTSTSIISPLIVLGDVITDNISVVGRFGTDLLPITDAAVTPLDFGSASKRWDKIYGVSIIASTVTASTSLTSNGSTFLGDAITDTITCTGRFNTDLLPLTDAAVTPLDLGSAALNWDNVYCTNTISNTVTAAVTLTSNGSTFLGNASTDSINFTGNIDTDVIIDGGKRVRSYDSQEIGLQVTNDSITTGTEGTVQIPWLGASSATKGAADTDFGNATACIGINEIGGTPYIVVRKSDGSWWGMAMTSLFP